MGGRRRGCGCRPGSYVPQEQWRPVTVTATAAGVSATATATPTVLSFDPGDGSAPVSCTGPGRAWVFGQDKNFDPAPGGCSYAYPRSSYGFPEGMVTATYAITWQVTWSATGRAGWGVAGCDDDLDGPVRGGRGTGGDPVRPGSLRVRSRVQTPDRHGATGGGSAAGPGGCRRP